MTVTIEDRARVRMTFSELGVAGRHGIDPMAVFDVKDAAGKTEFRLARQVLQEFSIGGRPFARYVIIAQYGDDLAAARFEGLQHRGVTDVAGMHRDIAVADQLGDRFSQYAVGVGE